MAILQEFGLTGSTNPTLRVISSTEASPNGVSITSDGTGGTVSIDVIDTGADSNLAINAKWSGTVAFGSAVSFSAGITGGVVGGVQTLAAAGAVNLTTAITRIDSAGAIALTLADGTNGQIKYIVMGTDGGDATLTPTTKTGFSTITFNDAGDWVTLVFITTKGWIVVGNNWATLA